VGLAPAQNPGMTHNPVHQGQGTANRVPTPKNQYVLVLYSYRTNSRHRVGYRNGGDT